ncbi:AI-2E family transporter [Piscicoccus intestinalis]|uniref:AI-2E family transporter n=1 Tax=Piscicoccus intestinalis TaxID=746033 RepID=UPI001FE12B3E|nr:AI-2E family transporter [Piscicoccus intestinalis]
MLGRARRVDDAPAAAPPPAEPTTRLVVDARSVWVAAWIVVCVVALALFVRFVFADGGSIFFSLALAFFFALAIEPVVRRLARRMPRAAATGLTFVALAVLVTAFFATFGRMLTDQLAALVQSAPQVVTTVLDSFNHRFHTAYTTDTILGDLGVTSEEVTSLAGAIAGGLVGLVSNTLGLALSVFSFVFLAYFVSAGLPNLRAWIAGLLRPRGQVVFNTVWQLMVIKVGGYVAARMTLAVISGTAAGLFMWFIDMPYWLPLGMWTGLVAQFVPTVGTYIAIALPVIVGFASDEPTDGLWVLLFAVAYQQIENVTIEPRISARAVNLHPAVSFVAALLGASLFGVAGALLGVPLAATIMAIFDIYSQRYEVSSAAEHEAAALVESARGPHEGGVLAARRSRAHAESERTRARGDATAEALAE